jgi:hypothetical protein
MGKVQALGVMVDVLGSESVLCAEEMRAVLSTGLVGGGKSGQWRSMVDSVSTGESSRVGEVEVRAGQGGSKTVEDFSCQPTHEG